MTEEFRETEFKFRVNPEFDLPDLTTLDFRIDPQPPLTLDADYYDTERTTLLRWGITLRRRSGGSDDGWHAKVPILGADVTTRDEIRVSALGGSVPTELVQILAPLLRGQDVVHRAHVTTQRRPYLISSSADEALVQLVDDHVDVSGPGIQSHFRELELELVADSPAAHHAVTRIGALLRELGASPSSVSKAASALGDLGPLDVPEFPPVGPNGLAVDALRSVLARYVRHLVMSDIAVRRGLPDSVHQMRVAARRLRSTFSTYRSLLDADAVAPVREDLSWLARELGAVRDTEVIRELLVELGSKLDEAEDRNAALETVDRWYARRMPAARASVMAALRTDRHDQLLEDLIAFVTEPPVTDDAFRPVEDVLLPRVRRTWRRLAHRVDALDTTAPDEHWHEVRISAKTARYATEGLGPVMGKHMTTCAGALAKVTDLLGTHQDAHVARTVLRTLATGSETSPREAFALGMMSQHEAERQQDFRKAFRHLWPHVVHAAHKAGLE